MERAFRHPPRALAADGDWRSQRRDLEHSVTNRPNEQITRGNPCPPPNPLTAARSTIRSRVRRCPGAHAVQFARHQPAHVGRPGAGLVAALPSDPLRPPRPRPVRRAQGPLLDGHAGPRCARGRRRRRRQDLQLVRPVDGRHGRPMDGRQRPRPRAEARALQHALLLRRQAALA